MSENPEKIMNIVMQYITGGYGAYIRSKGVVFGPDRASECDIGRAATEWSLSAENSAILAENVKIFLCPGCTNCGLCEIIN